jgi:exocyst complex component 4
VPVAVICGSSGPSDADPSVRPHAQFNPITLALGLLGSDSSTRYNFQQLSDSLLGSLQSTVQTHSASFASSISTHNSFLGSLAQSQREVRQTKVMLVETKEALRGEKRAEINALSSRARVIKEMMDTLDTMCVRPHPASRPRSPLTSCLHYNPELPSEQLKSIPEQLETLIAEKRLLLAALVLVRSTKTISKPALREVGALSDLRGYFSTQKTVRSPSDLSGRESLAG